MTTPAVHLRVCSFQGLQNLPVLAAQRQGMFARYGVDVSLTYTNSSAQQLAALARGEYELIHTAPDNVINFDAHPEAFGCDPATAPRVRMLLGGSNGPLSVYARPGITTAEQLRGASVGVDNPTSGFAIVLRDLLERAELTLDRDYTFAVAGGTGKRAAALIEGTVDATILYPPFDLVAERAGCSQLAVSTVAYPAYASQALAGTDAWVEAHGDSVLRYIRALLTALRWIYSPATRADVEALLASEPSFGLAGVSAASAYSAFTDPRHGFGETAALDDAGLAQVLALRARYDQHHVPLGLPADYHNLRWYAQALASLDEQP